MGPIRTEGDIDQAFRQARLAATIFAWSNRGLFGALAANEPCLLSSLPGDARALRVTARILGHAGLLARHGERWALSTSGRELFEGGVLGEGRSLKGFEDLAKLGEVIADGGPIPDEEGEREGSKIGVNPDDPKATRAFLKRLHRRSSESARQVADWVDRLLDDSARVIDLGGGHGGYARQLAERGHRATVFDLPPAVEVARDLHGEALSYLEGDFFTDDLGGPYDVALASNIVHGLSAADNRRLFERVADCLAPAGLFIIKDMFLDDMGLWPERAAYFGMTMLLYTDGGDSYSLSEVHRWFEASGLEPKDPVVFDGYALAIGGV